jgi:hypothetical protein
MSRHLPNLETVKLADFSLFQNKRQVDVDLGKGVFCLAGANGMGKSSFLAAINFGYTGIVARPNRSFRNVNQYYADSIDYSSRYFEGRISELDRDTSTVSLTFRVANHRYEITRNLFEPQALRHLNVTSLNGRRLRGLDIEGEPNELHESYAKQLVADCGLATFEQFVFIQQFLLTFDERRHLIFWDPEVADAALYLSFGLEADEAARAGRLRSQIDKAESNARNAQWQATNAKNRLLKLTGPNEVPEDLPSLLDQYRTLESAVGSRQDARDEAKLDREDSLLKLAEASSREQILRREYDEIFARHLASNHSVRMHPLVLDAVRSSECGVCGASSELVQTVVSGALTADKCPFCSSNLVTQSDPIDIEPLKAIDTELLVSKREVQEEQRRYDRLNELLDETSARLTDAEAELDRFSQDNISVLPYLDTTGNILDQQSAIRMEQQAAIRRRDEFRQLRDECRAELQPLQDRLSECYKLAELEFVPSFRQLAKRFIGLELDAFLERESPTTFRFGLEVQGTRRRTTSQLSESQRFFLDIALRMALAKQMTGEGGEAGMVIDTPEGSLDIAYEARAGSMFAEFAMAGHQIVMTANINASQLLLRLAATCGSEYMKLARMTDWAPLSEVQAEEEGLFDTAYEAIENQLQQPSPAR